jgi:hypothetical protein
MIEKEFTTETQTSPSYPSPQRKLGPGQPLRLWGTGFLLFNLMLIRSALCR